VFICLCAGIAGYSVWNACTFAEAQRPKIYVLDGGKSLMLTLSQDLAQNREVEAREHVKRFHELFFTLAPDKNAIESNVRRALLLVDKSAFAYYRDLQEKGYYNRIISGNIVQNLQVDSVSCSFDTYMYRVMTCARQLIIRESNITERSLVTRCNLINSVRSDNNPHGFMMEAFEVLQNRDLRVAHYRPGRATKDESPHKRSDESRHRLRQTAGFRQCFFFVRIKVFPNLLNTHLL
jgi:conjugative transposon TraK protein